MKLQNQELQEATCLSKILSFLIFQSSQLSMRVASVKNSASLLCFASKSLSSKLRERFQLMLIFAQHCLAKGHVKNRWLIVSAAPVLHIMQNSSLRTKMCLLVSIVFVFSLSTRSSQAKNLILLVHLDFQIDLKTGWQSKLSKACL